MEAKKNPSKDVHRYSTHFFFIGLCLTIVMVITAFEWRTEVSKKDFRPQPPDFTGVYIDVPIVVDPDPQPVKQTKRVYLIDPTKIVAIPDNPTVEDTLTISTTPPDGPPSVIPIDMPVEPILHDTFILVEKMPVPIGGFEKFYKELSKSLKYPYQAKRSHVEGKVFVEFVIDRNGEPVNFKIVKGIGSGCDEEAIRVLRMQKWEPGKQRGNPVHVKMTLPVYFKLN